MSNKVYKIGFISLLVLNILLTLVIWRGAKPPFEGGGNANFKNRISKNLELTDEQEKYILLLQWFTNKRCLHCSKTKENW